MRGLGRVLEARVRPQEPADRRRDRGGLLWSVHHGGQHSPVVQGEDKTAPPPSPSTFSISTSFALVRFRRSVTLRRRPSCRTSHASSTSRVSCRRTTSKPRPWSRSPRPWGGPTSAPLPRVRRRLTRCSFFRSLKPSSSFFCRGRVRREGHCFVRHAGGGGGHLRRRQRQDRPQRR